MVGGLAQLNEGALEPKIISRSRKIIFFPIPIYHGKNKLIDWVNKGNDGVAYGEVAVLFRTPHRVNTVPIKIVQPRGAPCPDPKPQPVEGSPKRDSITSGGTVLHLLASMMDSWTQISQTSLYCSFSSGESPLRAHWSQRPQNPAGSTPIDSKISRKRAGFFRFPSGSHSPPWTMRQQSSPRQAQHLWPSTTGPWAWACGTPIPKIKMFRLIRVARPAKRILFIVDNLTPALQHPLRPRRLPQAETQEREKAPKHGETAGRAGGSGAEVTARAP